MKKIFALLLLLLLCVSPALADQNRVIDDADVLTAAEEEKLEAAISILRETYQFDVVLLTKTSIDGKVPRYYAGDYYDYGGFGYGKNRDGTILLLVTGNSIGNRDYTVVSTGRGERVLNDDVLYEMEDNFIPYLRVNNFAGGLARFVTDVEARLASYTPMKRTAQVAPIILIAGIAIGVIVALVLKGQMRTVRRKIGASSYVREGSFHLSRIQDIYLYTTTVRHKIETQSSGGRGGGGGFTGSSGTHHSSHSGKF